VTGWKDHLIIAPILLPLLAGALMILIGERRRNLQATLGLVSVAALLVVAIALLAVADSTGNTSTQVYRLGNWPSLFAIVLALDRLSALMLVLTAILGLAALVYSLARWHRAGAHFHPLFQFQLMGLNGAFLTGDLFNLFVFFEVMLAASYGLALHGSGAPRVRAGLHYIVVNLTASLLFLVGVSMLYGVAGTLNMADLAARIPAVAPEDRALVETGAAILGVAFLIKAAMWPLGFWLPTTYAAASAPAAAILSILSKVGIYAVLRLWLLLFGAAGGASAGFGGVWLLGGGLLSIAFGSVAVLATQNMARLAGSAVLVSSGTLLAAIGVGQIAVTSGALFYMASSVLAIAGFFLLTELIERGRDIGADMLAVTREAYGEDEEENPYKEETGVAIPATKAILGMSFMGCALVLAGLPPLSGFIAKLTILVPLFAGQGTVSVTTWVLLAALLLSGMAMIIAMTRSGIDAFWVSAGGPLPRVRMLEIGPVLVLLILCVALSVKPAPVLRYMQAAAQSLHAPQHYVRDVLSDRGSQAPALAPGGGR
jgi:multicomponent K+:H+ antiporter subunit D